MQQETAVVYRPVTRTTVEHVYDRAMKLHKAQAVSAAKLGLKVATHRPKKFMVALEKLADEVERMDDELHGRTRRSTDTDAAYRSKTTEASIIQEAYRCAEQGNPTPVFAFVYAAVAEFAGEIEHQGYGLRGY